MGYYIQTPGQNTGKAQYIIDNFGGVAIPQPLSFSEVPENKGLVSVVGNPWFEAAAYCYDPGEFEAFTQPDDLRPKTWLLLDKSKAEELSGFSQ